MANSMTVRPFDWRDIPTLHRYRHESVFLDSALVLTRGPLLVPGALLSYLAPAMGVITAVFNGEPDYNHAAIGQVIHIAGSPFAHLTFLTPDSALESPAISTLLDYMISVSGERGAFRLLADVDEQTEAFEALRRQGFAIFTRQRIWQLTQQLEGKSVSTGWKSTTSKDAIAIRSLYNNLVPGLVQQVEPFATQRPRGAIYYRNGELLAFVEFRYGHKGIWVQPFIHPDAENIVNCFVDLLRKIPSRLSRPVYICVRSYQSWMEGAIEEIGAEAGPRQAVMVKHLASLQKVIRSFALPALESGHPEVTAPVAHSEIK